jgi:hypothetical protein
MDRRAILAKIRKCMALSASSNEHEAAAALRQARKLMEAHGLTDDDVLAAEAGEDAARAGADQTPANWEAYLAGHTAQVFGCRCIFRPGTYVRDFGLGHRGAWLFVGTGANFEVSRYCFEVLLRQVKRARAEHIKTALKRCKTATKTRRADLFCEGWVASAVGKVDALALGEREQAALAAYMAQHHGRVTQLDVRDRNAGKASLSDRDYRDYAAGRRQGAAARLERGVGSDSTPLAIGG